MDWRTKIGLSLKNRLPGELSHRKMLPPERELQIAPGNANTVKKSGVLLLIYPENGELYLCLIKRPVHMKNHAGQVALPGGKIEKKDAGPREAAIRETREEIGVLPEQIEILGSLSELYISVTGFLIHPFVGWTPAKPTFQLNHDEVEKLLLFPLLTYLQHQSVESVELDTVTGKLQVPAILFEGEIIWGATAMILSEFADLLAPALAPE